MLKSIDNLIKMIRGGMSIFAIAKNQYYELSNNQLFLASTSKPQGAIHFASRFFAVLSLRFFLPTF